MVIKLLQILLRWLVRITFLLFMALFIQRSTIPVGSRDTAITMMLSPVSFDYVGWEINAIGVKIGQALWGVHPFMDEASRSQAVRDYFDNLRQAEQLESQIAAIYADPNTPNPETSSAALRNERNTLRADLNSRQALVEAILEGQVAAVLVEEGFGVMGQLIPPISMHFTAPPNLLVVSPRDEIRIDFTASLKPMSVDEEARIESEIDAGFDVSSMIVPIGGMALYPAMILEISDLRWAVETFAHEWSHHYLLPTPLGLNYDISPETRSINETTADIFGKEIGRKVLERYYPEMVSYTPSPNPFPVDGAGESLAVLPFKNPPLPAGEGVSFLPVRYQPPPFDFGAAMHETRVTVDDLLAQGKVEEAEVYMEERREYFYDNGYNIRKLNQAYFAFYGGYQAGIPGIAGEDPIGPAVRDIRESSPTLRDFMLTMQNITTRDELLEKRDSFNAKEN